MPPVESPKQMDNAEGPFSTDQRSPDPSIGNGNSSGVADNSVVNEATSSSLAESDDDSRKLFVGGLSWQTTEGDLREYFSRWGKVTQCIIKLDRYTGNSRGFGFVTMENEECVNKVLSISDHWLKNKRIDPKKAKPSKETVRKVFVGGIDPEITEDQIREYFSNFGKVESLDLPFDAQKGKRKHYIFVSFANEAAARKAIAKERQEIFGRQCDVRVAVTREQANRQKAMKQWSPWLDPYSFAGQAYNEISNAYLGYDPFLYGYYGCDYANVPGSQNYGAYSGVSPNAFSGLTAVPKVNQPQRDSRVAKTARNLAAACAAADRILWASDSTGSVAAHHRTAAPQPTPQAHPQMNFGLMNQTAMDHHNPLSVGSGAMDFNNPSHTPQSVMANAIAGGYPHA